MSQNPSFQGGGVGGGVGGSNALHTGILTKDRSAPPGAGAVLTTGPPFTPICHHVQILRLNKQPNSAFTSLARTGSYVPISNHFDLHLHSRTPELHISLVVAVLVAKSGLTRDPMDRNHAMILFPGQYSCKAKQCQVRMGRSCPSLTLEATQVSPALGREVQVSSLQRQGL